MSIDDPISGPPPPAVGPRAAPAWPYALALAALVVLGIAFARVARSARRADPGHIDRRVWAWVVAHRDAWPGPTHLFRAVTQVGNTNVALTLTLVVGLVLAVLRRRGAAGIGRGESWFWLGVNLGSWPLGIALKLEFRRERPPLDWRLVLVHSYSFPSGHSVFAAVFFSMLALLLARTLRGIRRWAAILVCLVLAGLVAASRVWLGVHYTTDVLGGLALGTMWVVAAWLIRARWARPKKPVAGSG